MLHEPPAVPGHQRQSLLARARRLAAVRPRAGYAPATFPPQAHEAGPAAAGAERASPVPVAVDVTRALGLGPAQIGGWPERRPPRRPAELFPALTVTKRDLALAMSPDPVRRLARTLALHAIAVDAAALAHDAAPYGNVGLDENDGCLIRRHRATRRNRSRNAGGAAAGVHA